MKVPIHCPPSRLRKLLPIVSFSVEKSRAGAGMKFGADSARWAGIRDLRRMQ
jgi:hypothetical protein